MSSGFVNDPHSERGNACPRNYFNITDYAELQLIEAPLVASRIGEMRDRGITGKFDPAHLQAIHRHLFQDVFPWAGELRVVNISKGNANFGPAMHIAGALTELFERLAREKLLVGLAVAAFVVRAAFYLGRSMPSIRSAKETAARSASLYGSLRFTPVTRCPGPSSALASPSSRCLMLPSSRTLAATTTSLLP